MSREAPTLDEIIDLIMEHGEKNGRNPKQLASVVFNMRSLYDRLRGKGYTDAEAMEEVYNVIYRAGAINSMTPMDGEHKGLR